MNKVTELSDSALMAIRDGFDTRVAELFDAQRNLPFVKGEIRESRDPVRPARVNRFAYSITEYATANLWFRQNIDVVNAALVDYGDYFVNNSETIYDRDNFHWHSEVVLRLIDMFGQKGSIQAGLLEEATENKVLEAVWLYCKRRQADQTGYNTKAEADADVSQTWYIYESENHHSQSFCTQWHFAKLVKDRPLFKDRKYDDGRTALAHFESWNDYLKLYFTERAKKGIYIEIMSRDYNHKSLKGIFNIYDFTADVELKRKAGLYLDLYFTYWGQEHIDGVAGGGKSRLYQDTSQGTSEYGYLFFGVGEKPEFDSTILTAMTTTYRPPLVVVDIVCDRLGRGVYEVLQRPLGLAADGYYQPPIYHMRTDYGGIARYSYCTPDFVMGTSMFEARPSNDWTLISGQNRSHGVIFAGHVKAAILPQCEKNESNRSYNAQWSVQKKGTLITQKLEKNVRAFRSMVWFAADGLSEPIEDNGWIFAESAGAYAAVRVVDGGYGWEEVDERRAKGKWLFCENEYTPVILEVDQKSNYASFEAFRAKVNANTLTFKDRVLQYTGLSGDAFTFYADYSKVPKINNTPVNYAPPKVYDSPFLKADWNSGLVHVQKGDRQLVLDFNQ